MNPDQIELSGADVGDFDTADLDSEEMDRRGDAALEAGDLAAARAWYQRAADLGNASGMAGLGFLAFKASWMRPSGGIARLRSWGARAAC